jgi:hypothetical protein
MQIYGYKVFQLKWSLYLQRWRRSDNTANDFFIVGESFWHQELKSSRITSKRSSFRRICIIEGKRTSVCFCKDKYSSLSLYQVTALSSKTEGALSEARDTHKVTDTPEIPDLSNNRRPITAVYTFFRFLQPRNIQNSTYRGIASMPAWMPVWMPPWRVLYVLHASSPAAGWAKVGKNLLFRSKTNVWDCKN